MTRALLSLEQLLCVHHFGGQLHLEELELHLTPQVGQLDGDDGLGVVLTPLYMIRAE